LDSYRIERILNVSKDAGNDGYIVRAVVQGLRGHEEEPSIHGEMDISLATLEETDFRFYRVHGKKREKIRIDKPDRFLYVVKGWLKKAETPEPERVV
jgi:hypothetical protein